VDDRSTSRADPGESSVTIRSKLYAAIAVTIAGLGLTAGVGIWAMSSLADRFEAVQGTADDRALALELKFDIADFNGWQTAYGYDNGASRQIFLRSVADFRGDLARAQQTLDRPQEQSIVRDIRGALDDFMRIDATAYAALRAGRTAEVRRLFLGPEIGNFQRAAAAAQDLATLEAARATAEERRFDDARKDALRYLILASILAAVFVAILLATAVDLARRAEGLALAAGAELPRDQLGSPE
jgi:methyl-accepting chemotaxis protein